MYQCQNCQKKFQQEPLIAITDQGVYCSEECFPEEALDHPYSTEYISLVYAYREFDRRKRWIESFDERVELENEMEEVIENYQSYYLGDSEGHFYKAKIRGLYEKLLQLYDEVHNIFLNWEDRIEYCVKIYWHEVGDPMKKFVQLLKRNWKKKKSFMKIFIGMP